MYFSYTILLCLHWNINNICTQMLSEYIYVNFCSYVITFNGIENEHVGNLVLVVAAALRAPNF